MNPQDLDKLKLNASIVLEELGNVFEERNEGLSKAVALESAEVGKFVLMRFTLIDVVDGKAPQIPDYMGRPICLLGKPPMEHPTKKFSGAMFFAGQPVENYHLLDLPEGSYRAMAEIFYDFLVHGEVPGKDTEEFDPESIK